MFFFNLWHYFDATQIPIAIYLTGYSIFKCQALCGYDKCGSTRYHQNFPISVWISSAGYRISDANSISVQNAINLSRGTLDLHGIANVIHGLKVNYQIGVV